ncbi:MAG TPA: ABC-2 family transporter protein [Acetobacteraceae bacterium]|nr:ABC-2 family transporter protein [Acetobacteraceae bacterium]
MKPTPLWPWLRGTCAMARVGVAATLSARTVLLGRALFYLLVMTVLTRFWTTVAHETSAAGITLPAGILAYVAITEWIALSVPAIHLRLEDDIRFGAVEAHLLRPIPYLLGQIGQTIGAMLVRLALLSPGLGVVLLTGESMLPPITAWLSIIALAVLGGTVHILLIALAGLSAFWVRRTVAAYLVMQKAIFLLGGLFIPVTFYPDWLARFARGSPFAASLYWPAIVVLQPDQSTVVMAFLAVFAWIVALSLLCAAIWHAGLHRLLTQGI